MKKRLLVLTDISSLTAGRGEPDDTQSLIRLLLYTNEFDVEGLIATYSSHLQGCDPSLIHSVLDIYAQVQPNLLLHDAAFPAAETLRRVVKAGNPCCGLDQVGEGRDTEGSDWIIRAADRADDRPLWIVIWGGPTDLAQALWRVSHTRTEEAAAAFRARLRVYAIHDQYDANGPWIRETYPDLCYITAYQTFRGMYRAGDEHLSSVEWVTANLTEGHGPLGAAYPVYDGGDNIGPVKGMKEGDTPSFLYLIPNGLNDPEDPTQSSWGGRFLSVGPRQYSDARDAIPGETSERATVARWRQAYQADFAARMDWCVKPYEGAKHPPQIRLDQPERLTVRPGERVCLDASGSTDPDGDGLVFCWSVLPESSCAIRLEDANQPLVRLTAPQDAQAGAAHILLTVRKEGTLPLERYRRIIVNISI